MSVTNKHHAHGVILEYDSDGVPTWVAIPQLKNFNGPGMSVGEHEATTHDSGGWKETIPDVRVDPGEVTGSVLWDPDDPTAHLWLELNIGVRDKSFRVTFPSTDSQQYTFVGFVKEIGQPEADDDGLLMRSFTIRIQGAITRV